MVSEIRKSFDNACRHIENACKKAEKALRNCEDDIKVLFSNSSSREDKTNAAFALAYKGAGVLSVGVGFGILAATIVAGSGAAAVTAAVAGYVFLGFAGVDLMVIGDKFTKNNWATFLRDASQQIKLIADETKMISKRRFPKLKADESACAQAHYWSAMTKDTIMAQSVMRFIHLNLLKANAYNAINRVVKFA